LFDAHDQPRRLAVLKFIRLSAAARYALVTLALLLLTALATGSHLFHFGSTVLGAGGDVPESIRLLWAVDVQGGSTFTVARDHLLAAPDGTPVLRAAALAAPIFNAALWVLGQLFGWVVAMNGYNLGAFVLSGTAMFVLLDRLRISVGAAVFGTYVFTFNPNHVEKVFGSVPLAATGILPLLLLALLKMRQARTVPRALVAGALVVAAFYLDSYLGLLAFWLLLVFAVVDVASPKEQAGRYPLIRSYYLVLLVWVVGMAPVAVAWAANSASVNAFAAGRNIPLVGGSASLQTYLLPGPRNPWLGAPMRSWLVTHLSWESTMFVGYTTIALAILGIWIARKKSRLGTLGPDERMLVIFAVVLVVSAAIASLPATVTVAGLGIPTPQWFIFRLTAVYRVYSRFGVLVDFGLILLAVYALSQLPARRFAAAVPLVALAVVAAELYVPRPQLVRVEQLTTPASIAQLARFESGTPILADLSRPPQYVEWLRTHGSSIVADYPNPAVPDGRWAWKDIYEQYNHHLALWEMAPGRTDESGARDLAADLDGATTPSVLAVAGVRWVVVHRERYKSLGLPVPDARCGLRRVATFPSGVVVYRVTASADATWVSRTGFDSLYNRKLWPESIGLRWMEDRARIRIYSPRRNAVFLSAFAVSLGKARTLTLAATDGHIVGTTVVNETGASIKFQFAVAPGFSDYTLTASPGEQPRGEGDSRRVSVAMSPFQFGAVDGSLLIPACPRR
jgi:hypothetical protein